MTATRDRLLADARDWPAPEGADAAGLQLMMAAVRNGITPPAHLATAPGLHALAAALAVDPRDAGLVLPDDAEGGS